VTYPVGSLRIPAERDIDGRMSIEWFRVSVCATHGSPATVQRDMPILGSTSEWSAWWMVNRSARMIPSAGREWAQHHPSIAAVWPLCEVCQSRAKRRLTWVIVCAVTSVVSLLAAAVVGVKILVAALLLTSVGSVVVLIFLASRRNDDGTACQAAPDLSAVVVTRPHPAFYEEATRAIRNRGYGGYSLPR
jgi:hypothetical protein